MTTPRHATAWAEQTFNAAANAYEHEAGAFRDTFGHRTVDRLHLRAGAHVLDVCCGSGAATLPAAERVGPDGLVLGVDLAEQALALGRLKAADRGLTNVEFRVGDMLDLRLPAAAFDAVTCAFGLFFVPDMVLAVREQWRLIRPGGQLAVTTWGPRRFEPANTLFWGSIRAVRPDLHHDVNPWERLAEPGAVRSVFAAAGAGTPHVLAESNVLGLDSPDHWWRLVLGSAYRGTLEQMDADTQERVRQRNLRLVRDAGIRAVAANVLYAVATKALGKP